MAEAPEKDKSEAAETVEDVWGRDVVPARLQTAADVGGDGRRVYVYYGSYGLLAYARFIDDKL